MPVFSIRVERSTAEHPVRHGRTRRRVFGVIAVAAVASLAAAGLASATGSIQHTASQYTALDPVRVLNGRVLTANGYVHPVVAGGTTPVPGTATSVVLNVDVSAGTTGGTLEVGPNGTGTSPQPTIRWTAGRSETQQVTVAVGQGGKITLKNLTGTVTVTMHLVGYYAPPDTPTTYVTSPVSANFLWNSQYILETSANSYTEYFTRYDDVSVPALTQSALDSGSLQVFLTPSPTYDPSAWIPMPYQFDSSFGYTYNFTYVASPGHVVLMFYFIETDPSAIVPTLSTYAINTYHFKIVVTPNSAGETAAVGSQRPLQGHATCTPIPGGRTCTVSR